MPYTYTDIGVDGRSGTSDDRTLTFYGMPERQRRQLPEHPDRPERRPVLALQDLRGLGEQALRQQVVGVDGLRLHADLGLPEWPGPNPNNPGLEDRTLWNFKASGSYDGPWGIRLSPVLRHQSGSNYARTLSITAPAALGLTVTSSGNGGTAYAEAMDANREDNIWVFDVRAEKNLTLTSRMRLRLYFDAFNLTNSHASETISRATGLSYQKPAAILAPRTARVGFRFIF